MGHFVPDDFIRSYKIIRSRKAGDRYTTYSKEGSRILPRLFAMACFATHIHFLLITSSKKKLGLHALNRKSKNETAL